TYGEFHRRAQKLANALTRLGVKPGDRVATLAWNHCRHLEAYFAVPICGGVLHTLNPRLSVQDIAYIINHADDSVVILDDVLWPLWERLRPEVKPRHVNAWGLPFTATMVGAKQVFPGPHLDPVSVLNLLADEQVTLTAGVPTVWLAILDQLDCNPGKWNLKSLHTMIVGGSAAPQSMIECFEKRHGLRVVHAWGM